MRRGEPVGAFCRGDLWEPLCVSVVFRFPARRSFAFPGLPFTAHPGGFPSGAALWLEAAVLLVKDERWCCAGWLPWRITIWQEGERLLWVRCYRVAHFLAPRLSPCFWGLVPDYRLLQEMCAFTSVLLATRECRGFVWVCRIPLTCKRFVAFGVCGFSFFFLLFLQLAGTAWINGFERKTSSETYFALWREGIGSAETHNI